MPGAVGRHEPTAGAVMIAYLFWHCAYPTTTAQQYEEVLMRFQQRIFQQRIKTKEPNFMRRPAPNAARRPHNAPALLSQ